MSWTEIPTCVRGRVERSCHFQALGAPGPSCHDKQRIAAWTLLPDPACGKAPRGESFQRGSAG